MALTTRVSDPFFIFKLKLDPGLSSLNEGGFQKLHGMNIVYNLKILLFCFNTFGGRRSIDVLDPENQPGSVKIQTGSRALGPTENI